MLPADTLDDLKLSITIFEDLCNEHRLSIATAKTFLTVFHPSDDSGVSYESGQVVIDGQIAEVRMYGEAIAAVSEFKYLGRWLNSVGSSTSHVTQRIKATERATGFLRSGIARIPCAGFALLQ